MTQQMIEITCPYCQRGYKLGINLERLLRLRSQAHCSRCNRRFDVLTRFHQQGTKDQLAALERVERLSAAPKSTEAAPAEAPDTVDAPEVASASFDGEEVTVPQQRLDLDLDEVEMFELADDDFELVSSLRPAKGPPRPPPPPAKAMTGDGDDEPVIATAELSATEVTEVEAVARESAVLSAAEEAEVPSVVLGEINAEDPLAALFTGDGSTPPTPPAKPTHGMRAAKAPRVPRVARVTPAVEPATAAALLETEEAARRAYTAALETDAPEEPARAPSVGPVPSAQASNRAPSSVRPKEPAAELEPMPSSLPAAELEPMPSSLPAAELEPMPSLLPAAELEPMPSSLPAPEPEPEPAIVAAEPTPRWLDLMPRTRLAPASAAPESVRLLEALLPSQPVTSTPPPASN